MSVYKVVANNIHHGSYGPNCMVHIVLNVLGCIAK